MALYTVAASHGLRLWDHKTIPASTTIWTHHRAYSDELQRETDKIISARDAQLLNAAIYLPDLKKQKPLWNKKSTTTTFESYTIVLSAIKKKMKKISRYDDLKIPPP